MPQVRRSHLPPALLEHLLTRIKSREISVEHLVLLADWLATHPDVPSGRWFKRFPGMIVCGEDELIKTFLLSSQAATGEELK